MIVAVMCLVASEVRADDKANLAAARKLVELQLFGGFDDRPALTADYIGIFPGDFETDEAMHWRFGPPYIGAIKIENSVIGWSGSWGWFAADLAVMQRPYTPSDGAIAKEELHRYHLVNVFVIERGEVKLEATLLADTLPDAKLPVVTPAPGKPPRAGTLVASLVAPGGVKLLRSPSVAVIGSSASEVGLGEAAAKKLLAGWSKLQLAMVATPPKELVVGDLGIAFAEVDLMVAKQPRRLRGIVVGKKVGAGWEVAALAFGTDTPFGDPKIP